MYEMNRIIRQSEMKGLRILLVLAVTLVLAAATALTALADRIHRFGTSTTSAARNPPMRSATTLN